MLDTLSIEISNALFRVAGLMKQPRLREEIESFAVTITKSVSALDFEASQKAIRVLQKMLILAESVGELHYTHSQVLQRQLQNLKTGVEKEQNSLFISLNLKELFNSAIRQEQSGKSDNAAEEKHENGNAAKESAKSGPTNTELMTKDRQDAVYEKIRQYGKMAMKDFVAEFPEVSERTLRYDLQRLCDIGMVHRVGSGGPASYYRVADGVADFSEGGASFARAGHIPG